MTGTNVVPRGVLVILTMVAMAAPTLFAQALHVYVFTARSEYVDADSKNRADSVKDINAIYDKDKAIVFVAERSSAAITLEVMRRATVPPDRTSRKTVRVKMVVGDYSTEIVGVAGAMQGWTQAAEDVVKQVSRWVQDNRAKILRK